MTNSIINRRDFIKLSALGLLYGLTGCVHLFDDSFRINLPISNDLSSKYLADYKILKRDSKKLYSGKKYDVLDISLKIEDSTEKEIKFHHYKLNSDEKRPVVLIFPANGGDYLIERHFAKYFALRGFDSAILRKNNSLLETLTKIEDLQNIDSKLFDDLLSGRYSLDYLLENKNSDKNKVGIFGVSRGGINTSMIMALEQRAKAGIVALAAGDLPRLVVNVPERQFVSMRERFKKENELNDKELKILLNKYMTLDPHYFADKLDPNKILFVATRTDRIIPYSQQIRLWEKMGKPKKITLPFGHYYSILALPFLRSKAHDFLLQKFA